MRVDDLPLPPIPLNDVPMLAHWPVRPVIALETFQPDDLWDDDSLLEWDAAELVWDNVWRDATCDFTGCEIDTGVPDESGLFPASRCVVQLDNADGRWSNINPDGTVSHIGPGSVMQVWAHNDEGDWWLFTGTVSRYDQRADDTVEIEAFDSFSDLAQPIGTFTPGSNGQKPGVRLDAILTAAGEQLLPHRFATGTVTLTAQASDQAPLEEMQTVIQSDGGVLFVDADGTILSFDRLWRQGRTDQVTIPNISDNVCTAEFIVWEPLISTNDEGLADRVILENVALLKATAGAAKGYTVTLSEQQWTLIEEGNVLAALMLTDQSKRRLAVEEFDLYLLDPKQPDIWRAVDWRQLDRLRFVHDYMTASGTVRVDASVLLTSIVHSITPEGWTLSGGTSKALAFEQPVFYDSGELYDETPTPEEYGF